ncbi:MAG TPA: NAD(P)H-hydrate dehydratase [Gemmatimonadales bacterium]|nr:NAD(P)H-hydrate dehydratase [Gemmatimonadales bacterium]
MSAVPVLSAADAAGLDARAESAGIALATLMDAAGRASAALLADRHAAAVANGVLVAAGPGNNGGDGWVLARALHRAGTRVFVAALDSTNSSRLNAVARDLALKGGVPLLEAEGPWPAVGLAVDAILGTGARGAPRPAAAALLDRLRELTVPLVALDGPTGLDLSLGTTHGLAHADLSITFGGVRRGHLLARDECGDVLVADIGHPEAGSDVPLLVDDDWAATRFADLPAAAHKGTRGRIVLVGGAPGTSGAIRLAARAALAAGAGYAHVVAPQPTAVELRQADPELLVSADPLDGMPGESLSAVLADAHVTVIGPGLGRGPERRDAVAALIAQSRVVVLDADALTVFHDEVPRLAELLAGIHAVLTPHPGEFRTLFPDLAQQREVDPWGAAEEAASRVGATIVLKGVPTVIATPGRVTLTVAAGTPGLGTAGSGDVLSGITGTFLAQVDDAHVAACLAAQALGRSGELAARRHTARAMRPADTIEGLQDVWREWRRLRHAGPAPRPPLLLELRRPMS